MSKAFDKGWHEGLLFKLRQNGIDGKLLALLTNYLSNRKQRVVKWNRIRLVRSVLGPLLFLVYINDLENGMKSNINFFADDTSPFSVVHDPQTSAFELNHDLGLISTLTQLNRLKRYYFYIKFLLLCTLRFILMVLK